MTIEGFLAWADRRHFISVRTATLGITLWMTWRAFAWAAMFSGVSHFDSIGTAAVIAAVTAPISALQAAIFKLYMEGKSQ